MYTYNKLHTRTYTQLLQKVYTLSMVIFLFSGCDIQFKFDSIVLNNTETIITIEQDDFQLDIYLEKETDLDISSIKKEDLLDIIITLYKKTEKESLKHIALFIPNKILTWTQIRPEKILATHTKDTDLANNLIGLNPIEYQTESKNGLIYDWLHELIHAAYPDDGKHERNDLWNKKSGLFYELYYCIIQDNCQ